MLVDKNWLYEQYNKFNKEFFGDELPYVDFIITNAKNSWGRAGGKWKYGVDSFTGEVHYCIDADTLFIQVSNYNDSPEKVKQQTLIHEMIHIADYYFYPEHFISNDGKKRSYDAHGEIFFMKEARRIGRMSDFVITPTVSEEEFNSSTLSDENRKKAEARASKGIHVIIQKLKGYNDNERYSISRFTSSNINVWLESLNLGHMNSFSSGYIYGLAFSPEIENIAKTIGQRRFNYQFIKNGELLNTIEKYKIKVISKSGSLMNYENEEQKDNGPIEKSVVPKREKSNNPFIKVVRFYANRISETTFNLFKAKASRGDIKALHGPMSFKVNTELGALSVFINHEKGTKLVGNQLYLDIDLSILSRISPMFIYNIVMDYVKLNESVANDLTKIDINENDIKNIVSNILKEVRYLGFNNYNARDWKDQYNQEPIKNDDRIRVFHGTSFETAVKICKEGVSGKEVNGRRYSYEMGMNPSGLFVTTNFNKAISFAYSDNINVILEFTAKASELETPVWNNSSSYFGQGSNPQPFNNREEREEQKKKYNDDAMNSDYDMVKNSDNPAMAERLFTDCENQALFVGDLNPNMIKRFWVKDNTEGNKRYIPLSYKQFNAKYGDREIYKPGTYGETYKPKKRLYYPNEEFNGWEDFAKRFIEDEPSFYRNGTSDENISEVIKSLNHYYLDRNDYTILKDTMFPKQIIQAIGEDKFRQYFNKFY